MEVSLYEQAWILFANKQLAIKYSESKADLNFGEGPLFHWYSYQLMLKSWEN